MLNLKQQLEQALNGIDGLRAALQRIFERIDEVDALEARAVSANEAIAEARRLRVERCELEAILPQMRVQREKLQHEVGALASRVGDIRAMVVKAASAA
jgi:hypothetical protein